MPYGITITAEMKERALSESKKRSEKINHIFETKNFKNIETDQIGFYGEFAFRELLGTNWQDGIRDNYDQADDSDVIFNGWKIDVKTETIPSPQIWSVLDRTIKDYVPYGRRLISSQQKDVLEKYDIVMIGCVERKPFDKIDTWFPIGWMASTNVKNEVFGNTGPKMSNGRHIKYPFSAYQIKTTELLQTIDLFEWLKQVK